MGGRTASYAFRHIHGRVGASDLAGDLSVDERDGRPKPKAALASQRLRLADLTAVVGGAPRRFLVGHPLSPMQQAAATRLTAEHRLLPDTPCTWRTCGAMDAHVTYRAETVEAGRLPIRRLALALALNDGLLDIDPLTLTLPQGQVAGWIKLDARKAVPLGSVDLRLHGRPIGSPAGPWIGQPTVGGDLGRADAALGRGRTPFARRRRARTAP